MIQLNLLPDLKKEFLKAQKTKSLVISVSILVTVVTLGLSALLFVYVTFLQQVQINLATDDIKAKETQLKGIADINKYLTVQSQLASLPTLHSTKGAYSRLFDYLGVINPGAPNNVNLSNMQITAEGQAIALTGTTASFETLNIFVDTLKNAEVTFTPEGQPEKQTRKMFDQVLVQSSGFARVGSQNMVSFSIKTIYNASAFDVLSTGVTASVPNITTTQSVTQSPNAQIFNSEAQP